MKDEGGMMKALSYKYSQPQRRTHHGSESQRTNKAICSKDNSTLFSTASRGLTQVLGTQILKAGTSVGAHYREAQRAKSNPDFISKIEGALQELDETIYWLELLTDSNVIAAKRLEGLRQEAEELLSILVTIARKVKSRPKAKKSRFAKT